ncbi:FecR domain-containing protein [Pelagicoccus enzymogenes]|uniref:FecR family protein n=1 Tax=Pelagicoccus enzymogenes TaxID=2773457 RepID=UPI00280CB22C|nr:FecR domain-containing protein [Pelagicoccus enzymogenes]MDQ8198635.1 FecR domain-containing protein [Pelagicoccus enzymogenes]
MKEQRQSEETIAEQAAEWAWRIDDGLSPQQEEEFMDWLESHEAAPDLLAQSQKTWKRFEILDPKHFDLAEPGNTKQGDGNSSAFSLKRWALFASAAAAFAILGILGMFLTQLDSEIAAQAQTFRYAEDDFYELEDGSTIDLNEGAEVVCKYSEDRREFWIKSGEAYFSVAKDPSRPFDVYAGETKLRAIGTQFNVKFEGPSVEILVTEGIVALSLLKDASFSNRSPLSDTKPTPKNLIQNQKAVVHRSDNVNNGYVIKEVGQKEISEILLWKPVTFTFDSTPLSEVVKSFNRHNEDQLIIVDSQIESLKIVATFRSNKLEGFINLLQATSNIAAEREGNKILLSSRND